MSTVPLHCAYLIAQMRSKLDRGNAVASMKDRRREIIIMQAGT